MAVVLPVERTLQVILLLLLLIGESALALAEGGTGGIRLSLLLLAVAS
jgi:hypothetical protein